MLGNRPSTTEDDLYPTALVQFGSALTSVAASAVQVTDLSNSTSTAFENSKGKNDNPMFVYKMHQQKKIEKEIRKKTP